MKKEVFGYYICIRDTELKEFCCDRGIVFAESMEEAIDKILSVETSSTEVVVHIEVFEWEGYENEVYSFYTFISDCNESKAVIEREMKDNYLI